MNSPSDTTISKLDQRPTNILREMKRIAPDQRVYYAPRGWITEDNQVRSNEDLVFIREVGEQLALPLPVYTWKSASHSWGYGGSGPAQLALDLLLDVFGEWPTRREMDKGRPLAWLLHQPFKEAVLGALPQKSGWTLPGVLIEGWALRWIYQNPARYNGWLLDREEDRLLAAMRPYEQFAEDGVELTIEEQQHVAHIRHQFDILDQWRESKDPLWELSHSKNYPPFQPWR